MCACAIENHHIKTRRDTCSKKASLKHAYAREFPHQRHHMTSLEITPVPAKKQHRRKSHPTRGIPRAVFKRLVQEIAGERKSDVRFQVGAIDALHTASENLLMDKFGRCNKLMTLCNTCTVQELHWKFD